MRYRILDQNGLNFLTFTIVDWIDLFTRHHYCDIVIDSLKFCWLNKGLIVCAYVIMPSHIHIIAQTDNEDGLSSIIQSFKSYTANQILAYIKDKKNPESRREWLLHHFSFHAKKSKTHSNYQIWQRDNHPIALYTPKVIRQKLAYVHFNPVIAKIVHLPEQFIYSSASNYVEGQGIMDVHILEEVWNDIGFIDLGI